jgi:serine/threonine-protein kinase
VIPLDFQTALAGRYALERELGRGGMGIVYRARDLRLERVVAIKLLPRELAERPTARDRFLREARTAARLSHPHIVPIHAVEEIGEFVFFVMAFVDGETLGARIRRDGPLKGIEAARILREVAWALAYAHSQGVIHRDVKPENILLERDSGRALVADFGIARAVTSAPERAERAELVGTPEYMSPEQASGLPVDGRSDLYSLGVVGYYALTARLPFQGSTAAALVTQHVSKPPPSLEAPGAPRRFVEAIEGCLAKDPARRFQRGEELADAIGESLNARAELPVPIRAFLSESRAQAGLQYSAAFLVAAVLIPEGLIWLLNGAFAGNPPPMFRGSVEVIAGMLLSAAVISPIALVLRSARRFLKAGYQRSDIVDALSGELAQRREEQTFAAGKLGATGWERLMRGKMYASLGIAALSGTAAFVVSYPAVLIAFGAFGLASVSAVATGVAALAASRSRLDEAVERRVRFWKGRIGRLLFRIAGFGLKRRADAGAIDRSTETALGIAAVELFDALPADARRQLSDLPDAVRALEARIQRLRVNGRAAELQEALAALEMIRLDLLRLHGGAATVQGLTADLGAARQIGERVDAMLGGAFTYTHVPTGPRDPA